MPRLQERKDADVSKKPVQIARAVYDAYVRKDREAIESLIADDFHFTNRSTIGSTGKRILKGADPTARWSHASSSTIS